jgi:hypothetical protein
MAAPHDLNGVEGNPDVKQDMQIVTGGHVAPHGATVVVVDGN